MELDDPQQKPIEGIESRLIFENGQFISVEQGRALLKDRAKRGRVLVDMGAQHDLAALARTIRFADSVLWCVRPSEKAEALTILGRLQNEVAGWGGKIHLQVRIHHGRPRGYLLNERTEIWTDHCEDEARARKCSYSIGSRSQDMVRHQGTCLSIPCKIHWREQHLALVWVHCQLPKIDSNQRKTKGRTNHQ